ncbi:hypothetical protein OIV83_003909 [Microbotryomycetes sp. JL201]|nr:hypothetical protein OIV83_003909 [Microbotryomycetes sp. JL201]
MSIQLTPLAPWPLPPTFLLAVDNALILLDAGAFDSEPELGLPSGTSTGDNDIAFKQQLDRATEQYLARLKHLAPTLSLVVLSHPLVSSVGLLPWLRSRCDLRCPVYATLPTREMGRWAVQEWVDARSSAERNQARSAVLSKQAAQAAAGKKRRTTTAHAKQSGGAEADAQGAFAANSDRDNAAMAIDDSDTNAVARIANSDAAHSDDRDDPWDAVWKVSPQEIRDAFLAVNAVRWTQPVHLGGALKGYTLVAHRSGHTLGGSLFTLRPSLSSSLSPASSSSSLLYAPVFNHVKEHHLDGAALLNGAKIDDSMRRMGVVVVGADRSTMINVKRVDRERKLLDVITTTMNAGGSVLIPTDPSARLLEFLVLLESHWSFNNLGQRFPLCLISRTGKDVIGFVRSLTEWMGGQVKSTDGGERVLKLGNLRMFASIEELHASIPRDAPKTILTVPATLSHGFSRSLFVDFAQTPTNVVLLTSRSDKGSLADWLWTVWNEKQGENDRYGSGKVGNVIQLDQTISLTMKRKVYLEGEELERYLQAEKEEAEREARHQAMLDRSRRMMNADGDESDTDDEDSDNEGDTGRANDQDHDVANEAGDALARSRRTGGFTGGAGAWDEFLDESALTGRAGGQSFDIYVKGEYGIRRNLEGLPRYRMFPVVERKRRVDAYGEAIDVDGWLRRGTEDDPFGRPKELIQAQQQALGKRAREEDAAEEPVEAPHKYVVEVVQVPLSCLLLAIDMEGASDGRALKTILPQINPRKLVIVGGSQTDIDDLATACKDVPSMTQDIYSPIVDECLRLGEEAQNFSIRLGDSIMASLRLSRVEDYDVAYVSGVVRFDDESSMPVLERTALTDAIPLSSIANQTDNDTENNSLSALAPMDSADTTSTPPPATDPTSSEQMESASDRPLEPLKPALFIGDLRLSLLKDKLAAMDVPSEFAGEGVLVCGPAPAKAFGFTAQDAQIRIDPRRGAKAVADAVNREAMEVSGGRVAVKKTARGKLVIEGTPGETYFVVRKAVYSLHAQAE